MTNVRVVHVEVEKPGKWGNYKRVFYRDENDEICVAYARPTWKVYDKLSAGCDLWLHDNQYGKRRVQYGKLLRVLKAGTVFDKGYGDAQFVSVSYGGRPLKDVLYARKHARDCGSPFPANVDDEIRCSRRQLDRALEKRGGLVVQKKITEFVR